jgi:leucyl/phenylalanyl-tRNA---protein transferase
MNFPDPRAPIDEGLIAVGGDLEPQTLLAAYAKGIFPWPQEGLPLLWFSPDPRGILEFADLHIPRSLRKFAKQNPKLTFTINRAFPELISSCRRQFRKDQKGTWILPEMEVAYNKLFQMGHILSLECWESGQLVGGIYGVIIDGFFSGESMFHARPNASKMCLWKLVEHLQNQGQTWMDIQMVTPLLAVFGGKVIPREEFLQKRGI